MGNGAYALHLESGPYLPQLEKTCMQQRRLSTDKHKYIIFFKKKMLSGMVVIFAGVPHVVAKVVSNTQIKLSNAYVKAFGGSPLAPSHLSCLPMLLSLHLHLLQSSRTTT